MSGLLYCSRLCLISSSCPRNVGDPAINSLIQSGRLGFLVGRTLCSVLEGKTKDAKKRNGSFNSFTVSYLVDSCGLSLESAKSKSKFVKLSSPERPNSVLTLLKSHGFTKDQITKVVKSFPRVLITKPETKLLPKLMFFHSIGFSSTETTKLLSACPTTLSVSLKNRLIPCYNSLKNILIEEKIVLKCLKRAYWFFTLNLQKTGLALRLSRLRELGVPEKSIKQLIQASPLMFFCSERRFNQLLSRACGLGFDPRKGYFVHGMLAFFAVPESTMERKFELYKGFGWSRDDFVSAVMRFPNCVKISDEKITSTMDFLVNNIGLQPGVIATTPVVLGLSLEKRIKPRSSVISVLVSKGLLKKEGINSLQMLKITDSTFMDKYVLKHEEYVEELVSIIEGK